MNAFNQAPELVRGYLLDSASGENEDKAMQELAYDYDTWDHLMDVVWDTVFGGLSKQEFSEHLKPYLGARKQEDVERSLLRYVIFPLGDLVSWDIDARLIELGVPQRDVQSSFRIALRPVSYGAAVRRIAAQARVSLLSEEMIRRVRELLISYVKGVRTIEQFLEMLQRRQDEGGVGLSQEQAYAYADAMRAFLDATQVMSEQEYADWLTNKEREAFIEKQREQASAILAEEGMGPEVQTPSVGRAVSALERAVTLAVASTGAIFPDETLRNRFGFLVSTRLRDVRSALQARQMLEREVKVGGLGLPPEQAEQVAAEVEKIYKEQRENVMQDEKKKIEETLEAQKNKIEERKLAESQEHAEWFQEKAKQLHPEDALRQALDAARMAPQGGGDAAGSAVSPSRVDGVRAAGRMMGLDDELAGMTLEAFRRLSKSPEQAILKIQQKFDTLHQESFERWTDGVMAWRRSPLQQTYLNLVTESFKAGMPVAQLAQSRRETDPSIPTPEELGAIVHLNASLEL